MTTTTERLQDVRAKTDDALAAVRADQGASAVLLAVTAEFAKKAEKAIAAEDERTAVIELEQAGDSAKVAAEADAGVSEPARQAVLDAHLAICIAKRNSDSGRSSLSRRRRLPRVLVKLWQRLAPRFVIGSRRLESDAQELNPMPAITGMPSTLLTSVPFFQARVFATPEHDDRLGADPWTLRSEPTRENPALFRACLLAVLCAPPPRARRPWLAAPLRLDDEETRRTENEMIDVAAFDLNIVEHEAVGPSPRRNAPLVRSSLCASRWPTSSRSHRSPRLRRSPPTGP